MNLEEAYRLAAEALLSADALLIGAGAGMGVDSGLPDFRGPEGFWKAYPPFRGRRFSEMSTPHWFQTDPQLAWGFFGHRLKLYRETIPHHGFQILRKWTNRFARGSFIFTSNVDGPISEVRVFRRLHRRMSRVHSSSSMFETLPKRHLADGRSTYGR